MTIRNLREWKTLGLLPPAEMKGRVGYYAPEVVARVQRIQRLHTEGFTLDLIGRMLEAGGAAADEVMRLAATLHAPLEVVSVVGAGVEQVQEALEALGLTPEQIHPIMARVSELTKQIAAIFEQVWMEHFWQPFVSAGMPAEGLPRMRERAGHVKPLALEAVAALFAAAMDEQIERGIARELARIDA